MLKDEEMYKGFTKEQVQEYRKEVEKNWGKKSLDESEQRVRKMSPKKWAFVKAEGEEITKHLAALMDKDPTCEAVQECIADWHKYLENFYPVTVERLRGLGNMYVEDSRFTAYYDKYRKGLAEFTNRAIQVYCNKLKSR